MTDTIEKHDPEKLQADAQRKVALLRIDDGDHFEVVADNSEGTAYRMTPISSAIVEQMIVDKRAAGVPEEHAQYLGPWAVLNINQIARGYQRVADALRTIHEEWATPGSVIDAIGPNEATPINGAIEWAFIITAVRSWTFTGVEHAVCAHHEKDVDKVRGTIALGRLRTWATKSATSVGEIVAKNAIGSRAIGAESGDGFIVMDENTPPADVRHVAQAAISAGYGGTRGSGNGPSN